MDYAEITGREQAITPSETGSVTLWAMGEQIHIRFYGELNDFLPPDQRQQVLELTLRPDSNIKDMIESLGVPHTEIDLILVNGQPAGFNQRIKAHDHLSVYPAFARLDISPPDHLQPPPLLPPRFVLDCHLGRLAAYLRLLGFDTLYRNNYHDAELAAISSKEERILLTCDRQLLMRREITRGYFVRSRQPHTQLPEVIQRYKLNKELKPFSRCLHCNGPLHPVEKDAVSQQLSARTKMYFNEFWQCESCGKIYWKGSHYERMRGWIANIQSDYNSSRINNN